MHTSNYWLAHFKLNATKKRIDWNTEPTISSAEVENILHSLQAWQLGETSEGKHLVLVSTKYAKSIGDLEYVDVVKLFIKEEQKHGNNLGRYLDIIGKPRVNHNWGDTLFRKMRYFNTSMESWTLAVITVESTAQVFYQALKDATNCAMLRQICTDILIDEAYHITFQTERLATLYHSKSAFSKAWRKPVYKFFFYATSLLVWFANRRMLKAGGNTFSLYKKKMHLKYLKTINIITREMSLQLT